MNDNQLIDNLIKKKNNAFSKLSLALTIDETSNSNEEKIENYHNSLKIIEEAISFYISNKNSFNKNDHQALEFFRQLNDIKSKTIIRITDLTQINIAKTTFTPSCLKVETSKSNDSLKIKKKLNKNDISQPTDFRLVQHIGLENNNFKINLKAEDDQSKKMIDLLHTLNIPVNKKTTTFIENFVKDNGGIDRFTKELNKKNSLKLNTEESSSSNKQKALSFYNSSFHKTTHKNSSETNNNKQVQLKLPTPPSTPPPPPPLPNTLYSENINNRLKVHYSENKFLNATLMNTPPPPPDSPPPPPPFPYPLNSKITSEEIIYENKLPFAPPPTPPPPLQPPLSLSTFDSNNEYTQINKPTSDRQNLLDSIRNFRGFNDSSSSNTQSPVQQSNHSDISIQRSSSSIVDQLKYELLKRSHYLNDSDSDGYDEDNKSDTSW